MQVRFGRPEYLWIAVALLVFANVFIFRTAFTPHELTISVLDVGQGDAILVRGPTGITMLVDGGPDRGVLRELGEALPIGDRRIDVVVATHPDKDHVGGLPDVFEQYEVEHLIESGVPGSTSFSRALAEAASKEPRVTRLIARRGMRFDLGGGAYADILYPDRDVSKVETNDGSVVMRVVYGTTSFMLTGDLASDIEDWLLTLDEDSGELDVDVLKAGHHGSKYSTSAAWLEALSPAIVAVSVGEHNSYGHPTPEVLARVADEGAELYRTDIEGRLVFTSDGTSINKK